MMAAGSTRSAPSLRQITRSRTARAAAAVVLLVATLGVVSFMRADAAQFHDAAIPDPTDLRVTELDSTLHVNWTPAEHPDTAWQVLSVWEGEELQQSKVVSATATVAQANGVTPSRDYTVKVHTLDRSGALSPGVTAAATARPQPPMDDAVFFDNFNTHHGQLDPDLYDVRTAFQSDESPRTDTRMIFNSEHHFHTQLIGGGGVGGINIRPRVPFDFTDRTGRFQFEVDFPPTQNIVGKWIEIALTKDIVNVEHDYGDATSGLKSNSINFVFFENSDGFAGNTPAIIVNNNGDRTVFRGDEPIYSPSNVRLPVVIEVSQTHAEMFVNGDSVVRASGYTMPYSTGYWNLVHRNYFSGRVQDALVGGDNHGRYMPSAGGLQLVHWDTVQFDGPPGSYHPVTKVYTQPGCDPLVYLDVNTFDNAPDCTRVPSTTIPIPDDLSTARSATLLVTGDTSAGATATINGHVIEMPHPSSSDKLLYLWDSNSVDVPLAWLTTGENAIEFDNGTDHYALAQIEVLFDDTFQPPPVTTGAPPLILSTKQNHFVQPSPDGDVRTVTTDLYTTGAPIDYTAAVASSDTPWLQVTDGRQGRLVSPVRGGALVPLTFTVDFGHPDLQGDHTAVEGSFGWIEVDGGPMPYMIGVMAHTGGAYEFVTDVPYTTTFNRAALPNSEDAGD